MNKEKEKDSTKLAALFVSVLALGTSIFLGYKANQHNALSVAPYLDITYIFQATSALDSGLRVDNSGLGPAIIENYKLWWNEGGNKSQLETWDELSEKIGIANPSKDSKIGGFKTGNVIRAESDYISLYGVLFNTPQSRVLEKAIKNKLLDITICYKSLYGDFKQSSLQAGVKHVHSCK